MCQNGIDYRGLMMALEQLTQRQVNLRKDTDAWADYFLEQEAAEIAAGLRNAVEALDKAEEYFAKVGHDLGHLNHDHDHQHVTVTHFSEK